MTMRHWQIGLAISLATLGICPRPCAGQTAPSDSAARDAVLGCAVRLAQAAGFQPLPHQPPGRVALQRESKGPGPTRILDGLRITVAPPDSAGSIVAVVRVGSFVVSRSTGLPQSVLKPRASLVALADSLPRHCRWRRGQALPSL